MPNATECSPACPGLKHCTVCTVLYEEATEFHAFLLYRQMQRCASAVVPGCRVCAVLHEEACEKYSSSTIQHCQVQRGQPVLVPDCRVCRTRRGSVQDLRSHSVLPVVVLCRCVHAFRDEQTHEVHTSPLHCMMYWGPPVVVLYCHVRAVLDEEARESHDSLMNALK